MFRHSKLLGLSTLFILISAVFHVISPVLSSFSSFSLVLFGTGIIYGILGYLTAKNFRALAWLMFLVMLFGGVISFALSMNDTSVPNWLFSLIMLADWAAALMLFGYLWKDKPIKA